MTMTHSLLDKSALAMLVVQNGRDWFLQAARRIVVAFAGLCIFICMQPCPLPSAIAQEIGNRPPCPPPAIAQEIGNIIALPDMPFFVSVVAGPVALPTATFMTTERVGQLTGYADPQNRPVLNSPDSAREWKGMLGFQ